MYTWGAVCATYVRVFDWFFELVKSFFLYCFTQGARLRYMRVCVRVFFIFIFYFFIVGFGRIRVHGDPIFVC